MPALLLGREEDRGRPRHDDDARQRHHGDLENAPALGVRRQLLAGVGRDLEPPVVERSREPDADRELARTQRRAVDDAAILVDHVDAARSRRPRALKHELRVEGGEGLADDAPDVVPGDDEVAAALVGPLPVADQVALPAVRVVQVAQLVLGRGREVHVGQHLALEQAPEGLLVPEGPARPGREREHLVRVVQHQDGADRRGLAPRGREPALGQLGEHRRMGDREDDVVLLDDVLVEAIGLLVGQAERRLEHRLPTQKQTLN